jgi:hypothetical protein
VSSDGAAELEAAYRDPGLSPSCDDEQLRRRFRELVKELHPDRNPDGRTAEAFRRVEHSYRLVCRHRRCAAPDAAVGETGATTGPDVDGNAHPVHAGDDVAGRLRRAIETVEALLPGVAPVALDATALTWRFDLTSATLRLAGLLIYEGHSDRFGIAVINLSVDGDPLEIPAVPGVGLCAGMLIPLTSCGTHPDLALLARRLPHWMARVSWLHRLAAPEPWTPSVSPQDWLTRQLEWVLPLLGIEPGRRRELERDLRNDMHTVDPIARRRWLQTKIDELLTRPEVRFG